MNNNLLGHLALRLGTHPDLWATEALHYILRSSQAARQSFIEYVSEKTHVLLPMDLSFRTQMAAKDGSIPDLIGVDEHNQTVLVVEAKFWAGLTENQPITYLKQTAPGASSLLFFIVPTARMQTLWPEVLGRCKEAKMSTVLIEEHGDVFVARAAEWTVAIAGWRTLLTYIVQQLELKGELTTSADARQLIGLCDQMDRTAFLPVHSEELAPQIGRRIVQFSDLVDELTEQLKREKIGSTAGLHATGTKYAYGRYITIYGYDCMLKSDYSLWGTLHETPLWFRVRDNKDARVRLISLEMEIPRVIIIRGTELLIPLLVPLGVEKSDVLNSLLGQIKRVTKLLERTVV